MSYASSNLTWENNFFEGGSGLDDQSLAGGPDISDISHYGNVNLNSPGDGLSASNHANAMPPSNISFTNDVVINAASVPSYLRCALNSVLTNVTIFNSLSKEPAGLFVQDNNGGGSACPSGATISATISKTEIFNSNPVNLIGFNIVSGTASISNSGTYNASSISNVQVTNPFTGNPGYGSCYLWAPDGSAAKVAGIGATVLYATEGGSLNTGKPLWNTKGQLSISYRGAIVTGGVNDPSTYPGQTLADLGTRLNIGQNGCALPSGYTPAAQ